jgi:hypothetical protein
MVNVNFKKKREGKFYLLRLKKEEIVYILSLQKEKNIPCSQADTSKRDMG